jgi:hypothetical protein
MEYLNETFSRLTCNILRLLTAMICTLLCNQVIAADNEYDIDTDNQNTMNNAGGNNTTRIQSLRFTGIEVASGIHLGQTDLYDENTLGFISPQKEFFYGVDNVGITIEKRF